jgi:hypothetical protein
VLGQPPGTDHGIRGRGVGFGEYPPRCGLRRVSGGSGVKPGQELGGGISRLSSDRGERAHPGQHRRRAQREHDRDRDRVIPALLRAPIGHPGKPLQQLTPLQCGSWQPSTRC